MAFKIGLNDDIYRSLQLLLLSSAGKHFTVFVKSNRPRSGVSDRCFKVHSTLPYQWEVKEGTQWTARPNNKEIEKDYCDPSKTYRFVLFLLNLFLPNLNGTMYTERYTLKDLR